MFSCAICHDLLINHPVDGTRLDDSDLEIRTSSCGHIFHNECIMQWFQTSNIGRPQCPQCRSATPVNKLIKLYPSVNENPLNSSTDAQSSADVARLRRELDTCKSELNEKNTLNQVLQADNEILHRDLNSMRDRYTFAQNKMDLMQIQIAEYQSYKEMAISTERKYTELKEKLAFFRCVQDSIENEEGTIEELMRTHEGMDSIRILASSNAVLKREKSELSRKLQATTKLTSSKKKPTRTVTGPVVLPNFGPSSSSISTLGKKPVNLNKNDIIPESSNSEDENSSNIALPLLNSKIQRLKSRNKIIKSGKPKADSERKEEEGPKNKNKRTVLTLHEHELSPIVKRTKNNNGLKKKEVRGFDIDLCSSINTDDDDFRLARSFPGIK